MKVYIHMEQVEFLTVYIDLYMKLLVATATIFICKVKIFSLLEELSHKIIPHFITEWEYV